ncbi:hypothetical protein HD806DRAFT_540588 [Xylariaceae sp. AK1471]|nr:hypothetical protein HD806DRAFT_540588 [Xylariaceae sp. AK1471]
MSYYEKWTEAAVQIDTATRLMKITTSTFFSLGEDGEIFFENQATMLLGTPAEFFFDYSNASRVYLASRDDLQLLIPCEIRQLPENRIPTMYPANYTGLNMPGPNFDMFTTYHSVSQLSNQGLQNPNLPSPFNPQLSMASPGFNFSAPNDAPGYPSRGSSMITPGMTTRAPQAKKPEKTKTKTANAFILYRKAHHRELGNQYPNATNGQRSKICADQWNKLSEDEREPYKIEADRLKKDYQRLQEEAGTLVHSQQELPTETRTPLRPVSQDQAQAHDRLQTPNMEQANEQIPEAQNLPQREPVDNWLEDVD